MSVGHALEPPNSDETLAFDVPLGCGVNASTKFGGTDPLKFGRGKNVQNLVRFTTTFEYDREYLWNR